jgi:hypothetical protein
MKTAYNPKRGHTIGIADQLITGGHQLATGFLQEIHEQSLTQNYDLGTRLVMDDRVFRYSKAGSNLTAMKAGHCGNLPTECNTAAVEYKAGTYEVTILDTTVRVADYYAEGYIWLMVSGAYELYRIKNSGVGAGVSVKLTLYQALLADIPASTWGTAWPNVYANILGATSGFMSNVVFPLRAVTSGYYFWGQTWGPCFGTVFNEVPGRASGDRELYFNVDGALKASVDVAPESTNPIPQRAGFLMTNTTPGGAGYGDQWFMLQLSP